MDLKDIVVCCTESKGKIIYEKKLTTLPLKEERVISKSIEFFNDPEPCMIHRSAVMARIYSEIGNYIIEIFEKGLSEISFADLPEQLRQYTNIESDSNIIIKKRI